jgi:hypothetical protein
MVRVDTGQVFLECEGECTVGFGAVVDGRVEDWFWTGDVEWESRPAEFAQVVEAGLADSIAWVAASRSAGSRGSRSVTSRSGGTMG